MISMIFQDWQSKAGLNIPSDLKRLSSLIEFLGSQPRAAAAAPRLRKNRHFRWQNRAILVALGGSICTAIADSVGVSVHNVFLEKLLVVIH